MKNRNRTINTVICLILCSLLLVSCHDPSEIATERQNDFSSIASLIAYKGIEYGSNGGERSTEEQESKEYSSEKQTSDEPALIETPIQENIKDYSWHEYYICIHDVEDMYMHNFHNISYDFLWELIDEDWQTSGVVDEFLSHCEELNKQNATDECPIPHTTIYEFIHYYNIPREVFEEAYFSDRHYYTVYYNVDLLYNGTLEEVEKYYRNNEYIYSLAWQRHTESSIKDFLFRSIRDAMANSSEWKNEVELENASSAERTKIRELMTSKAGRNYLIAYTLPEIIQILNIPKDHLQTLLQRAADANENKWFLNTFDFDAVYASILPTGKAIKIDASKMGTVDTGALDSISAIATKRSPKETIEIDNSFKIKK
ncbi:MAG: hypothetical protein E7665_08100 [Ruminococcaceae bacterium]|nr:hypothetical protein [Oscillospiraceae bacterium]